MATEDADTPVEINPLPTQLDPTPETAFATLLKLKFKFEDELELLSLIPPRLLWGSPDSNRDHLVRFHIHLIRQYAEQQSSEEARLLLGILRILESSFTGDSSAEDAQDQIYELAIDQLGELIRYNASFCELVQEDAMDRFEYWKTGCERERD
jgi:hypothetical protein